MKINEVEQAIGITKKNIRFYEQEGLLKPSRAANGYRDYTEEDLEALRQIKLLRKLDIPLEEIKRLKSGALTLEDCLRRHLIVLERRKQNLKSIESFCGRILTAGEDLQMLPMEQLLLEMEDMEKGGTKFMDIRKRDKQKRKQGAFLAAGCAILFMAWFLGVMGLAMATDPEVPVLLVIFIIAFPVIGITGILLALFQRIKEIEGGELDEASKY